MSVLRTRPLPEGELRGEFIVPQIVVDVTAKRLVSYADVDAGQEAMVFWAGRHFGETCGFFSVVEPDAEHHWGRVWADKRSVGRAAKAAREHRLGVVAQVHSHPGADTRHSDGDDEMVLMPFEGMLSIVVPNFGTGDPNIHDWSIHQYQDSAWVLCSEESIRGGVHVVPAFLDARTF